MLHHGEQGGLEVQRVKGRLGQQQIDAAVQQAADLLVVRCAQRLEGHVAGSRVSHVAGQRACLGRGAQRAGHETPPRGIAPAASLDRASGNLRCDAIHFVGQLSQAVLCL